MATNSSPFDMGRMSSVQLHSSSASAEAELYATASGVSEGIVLRKVLAFFGCTIGLHAVTDSSANNAVGYRLGVGKIRHLETKVLWIRDLVYDGRLVMQWIKGQQNPADLGSGGARPRDKLVLGSVPVVGHNDSDLLPVGHVLPLGPMEIPRKDSIRDQILQGANIQQVAPEEGAQASEAFQNHRRGVGASVLYRGLVSAKS